MNNPISPKVTLSALAGACVTVIVWLVRAFAGVDIPAEVAAALIVIVMVAIAWWAPDPLRDALRSLEQQVGVDALEANIDEVEGG